MIKNYWMLSNGNLVEVLDHFALMESKLKNKYTPEAYFTMLSRQGYLRIIETDKDIIIGYHPYRRVKQDQLKLLTDFSIERKKNLVMERDPQFQKPGIEFSVLRDVNSA
jgi:hypothetical protein